MKSVATDILRILKKRVLIVDDSIDLRELMAHFLASQGFETAQARNGKAAIEYLCANPIPDLVLLDSEMDSMNGIEFLEELELSHPKIIENLPIIGLSGVNRFVHRRIRNSLRKPVDFDKLESAIKSALLNDGF